MSLSLGQNAGYINNIETGKALPSMAVFFAICDYLDITPMEFLDESSERPEELRRLMDNMKKLNKRQLKNISEIVEDLIKKYKRGEPYSASPCFSATPLSQRLSSLPRTCNLSRIARKQ